MKSFIFALLAGSAAAFAPVAQKASSTALNMAFESEIGAQPPLGFFVSCCTNTQLSSVNGFNKSNIMFC